MTMHLCGTGFSAVLFAIPCDLAIASNLGPRMTYVLGHVTPAWIYRARASIYLTVAAALCYVDRVCLYHTIVQVHHNGLVRKAGGASSLSEENGVTHRK